MCNLYTLHAPPSDILKAFDAVGEDNFPTGDYYPKSFAPVIRAEGPGRLLEPMRWGFPPPAAGRAPVTNVRNLESPFWRSALANPLRRCLVPLTRFAEWEGEPGHKRKRWFSVPARPMFAFAGVWRPTEAGPAYAFLTTDPNPLVAPIHPKAMPVLLHAEDEETWLRAPWDEARALAAPFPSQLMAVE